jgi:hypothetical protein
MRTHVCLVGPPGRMSVEFALTLQDVCPRATRTYVRAPLLEFALTLGAYLYAKILWGSNAYKLYQVW